MTPFALLHNFARELEIVEACDKARIPIFLKNNLTKGLPIDRPFYKPIPLSGWDDNFSWELRQEFP